MKNEFSIRALRIEDYEQLLALWRSSEGIGLSGADSREGIGVFLERNPGLSRVVLQKGRIVGSLLCGHDGRRGYLYHLAVAPGFRRRGIAGWLVEGCLDELAKRGIEKCHLFVYRENEGGKGFWRRLKWEERDDISVFSRYCADRCSPSGTL